MIQAAVEQFLPCVVVGLLLTVVLMRVAPQDAWMLPGMWAVIFSLGVFASCRFLPRQMFAVGAWYLAAGLVSLLIVAGPSCVAAVGHGNIVRHRAIARRRGLIFWIRGRH